MKGISRQKVLQLCLGITAIYVLYFICGILQEAVMTKKYRNDYTGQEELFQVPYTQLLIVSLSTILYGQLLNRFLYKPEQIPHIPWKKSMKCGVCVTISVVSYSYAVSLLNFPIVMMARSCSILSTVLVAALFTGVQDKSLQLSKDKILITVIIIFGMAIFSLNDPNRQINDFSINLSNYYGFALILASLIADGFLPDFQAQIKSKYSPPPTVLMTAVNTWTFIITLSFSICAGQLLPIISFIFQHKTIIIDLLFIGLLSFLGQIAVYTMVKLFKQHILPFIVTTRKIFTVGISIAYYGHKVNSYQIAGVLIVLISCVFQFVSQLSHKPITSSTSLPPAKEKQ